MGLFSYLKKKSARAQGPGPVSIWPLVIHSLTENWTFSEGISRSTPLLPSAASPFYLPSQWPPNENSILLNPVNTETLPSSPQISFSNSIWVQKWSRMEATRAWTNLKRNPVGANRRKIPLLPPLLRINLRILPFSNRVHFLLSFHFTFSLSVFSSHFDDKVRLLVFPPTKKLPIAESPAEFFAENKNIAGFDNVCLF